MSQVAIRQVPSSGIKDGAPVSFRQDAVMVFRAPGREPKLFTPVGVVTIAVGVGATHPARG